MVTDPFSTFNEEEEEQSSIFSVDWNEVDAQIEAIQPPDLEMPEPIQVGPVEPDLPDTPIMDVDWEEVDGAFADTPASDVQETMYQTGTIDPDARSRSLELQEYDTKWKGIPYPITEYDKNPELYEQSIHQDQVMALDLDKAPVSKRYMSDVIQAPVFRGDEKDMVDIEKNELGFMAKFGAYGERGELVVKLGLLESQEWFGGTLTEGEIERRDKMSRRLADLSAALGETEATDFPSLLGAMQHSTPDVLQMNWEQIKLQWEMAKGALSASKEGATTGALVGDTQAAKAMANVAENYFHTIARVEGGNAQSEFRKIRTDEGDPIDKAFVHGGAIVYGYGAAALEVGTIPLTVLGYRGADKVLKSTFPSLEKKALKKKTKDIIKDAMVNDKKFRRMAGKIAAVTVSGAAAGGLEEMMQEAWQVAIDGYLRRSAGTKAKPLSEGVIKSLQSGWYGFLAQGPTQAVQASPFIFLSEQQRIQRIDENQQKAEFLAGKASESKAIKRSNKRYHQFVQDVIKEHGGSENVTMPVEDFTAYLEENQMDIDEIEKASPETIENYRKAIETGSDMDIPIGAFGEIFANDPNFQKHTGDARLHPQLLTDNEAVELQETTQQVRNDIKNAKEKEGYQEAVDNFKERLADLGTPEVVGPKAEMLAAAFVTLGERSKLTMDELENMFRLRVGQEEIEQAELLASITAIQTDQIPTDREQYGVPLQDYVQEFDDPTGSEAKIAATAAGYFETMNPTEVTDAEFKAAVEQEELRYAYGEESPEKINRAQRVKEVKSIAAQMGVDLTDGTPEQVAAKISGARMEQAAGWTDKRVKSIVNQYDQKAAVAWVHPMDFVRATTGGPAGLQAIIDEAGDLDMAELTGEQQTPFLNVDEETGEILGHEGRHRMAALFKAGARRVPVILNYRQRGDRAAQGILRLSGQQFETTGGMDLDVTDATPITWENQKQIQQMVGEEGKILFQTATVRSGDEVLTKYGLEPGKRYKTRAVAAALEARQRDKYGSIAKGDHSDQAIDNISDWMVEEVLFEMLNPEQSGVGWYSEKFQAALDAMSERFPELKTDQAARDTMTALIAITSDGQKVMPNFAMAMNIYGNFKETGKFTSDKGHTRAASILGNLKKLQQLYDEKGPEEMKVYLMQEKPVGELNKIARESGIKFNPGYKVDVDMPMAAVVFGPKLGAFYANLMGAHGYLTMDRWWSRTFNRYRGTLLTAPTQSGLKRFRGLIGQPELSDDETIAATVDPHDSYEAKNYKDGTVIEKAANTIFKKAFTELEDAPFNASDRSFMLQAVNRAQQKLEEQGHKISIADIQAILWYYEKRLYGELGTVMTADVSYEEAAQAVVAGDKDVVLKQEVGSQYFDEFVEGAERLARGYIEISPARDYFKITLTGRANLSTFLHESGHFFLEVMTQLSAREETDQQLKSDLDSIKQWVGWEDWQTQFTTEQHEKFARGYEAYLMEGKAPSLELVSAFRRFSEWLKGIYTSIEALDVNLNDEIRGVMGRLLASDTAIQQMQEVHQIAPAITDPKDFGMDDQQWADYQAAFAEAMEESEETMRLRLMKEIKAQKTKVYKDTKARITKQVTDQVESRPIYQALYFLKNSVLRDSNELPPSLDKLDRAAVKALFYNDKKILLKMPRGITKKNGADPDLVANHFGFTSAHEMLESFIGLKPEKQTIKEAVEEVMGELYGDSLENPEMIADEAARALHNDKISQFTTKELRLFSSKAKKPLPAGFVRQARLMAENEISKLQVSSLRSAFRFMQAEMRYAKEATQAAAKNDWGAAAEAKKKQLINHWMYRKAIAAKTEIDRGYTYLKKVQTSGQQQRIGKAGGYFLESINKILEGVELKKVSQKALARRSRRSLSDQLNAIDNDGEVVMVEEQFRSESSLKNYSEYTLAEFRDLVNAIKNLDTIARKKLKIDTERGKMEFNSIVAAVTAQIYRHTDVISRSQKQNGSAWDKAKAGMRRYGAEMLKPEFVFSQLDGEQMGIVQELFFQPIAESQRTYYDRLKKLQETLLKPIKNMPREQKKRLAREYNFMGWDMKGHEILVIALNMGNESNMKKLIEGYNRVENRGWTEDNLMENLEEILAPEDWDLVQHIWDELEQFWPEIRDLAKTHTGVAPPKVEPRAFKVGDKELRGGYYPVIYDPSRSQMADQIEEQKKHDAFERNFMRPNVSSGFKEARTGFSDPILLQLQPLGAHFNEVLFYLTHYDSINQVYRLLRAPQVKQAMVDTIGIEYWKELEIWLQNIANQGNNATQEIHLGRWAGRLAVGTSIVSMAGGLSTTLIQLLGLSTTMGKINPKWFVSGLMQTKDPKRWKFANENSNELPHLLKTFDRDARKHMEKMMLQISGQGRFQTMRAGAVQLGFSLIGYTQYYVSMSTWLGAYEKGVATMDMDEKQAAMYADHIVRTTQTAGATKDLARVQRSGELARLFTAFYGWFSALFGLLRQTGRESVSSGAGFYKASGRIFAYVMIPVLLEKLWREGLPDEDEEWDEWFVDAGIDAGLFMSATIPGVRDGISFMASDYGYSFAPVGKILERGWYSLKKVPAIMEGDKEWSMYDTQNALRLFGAWYHLPVRPFIDSMKYFDAYLNGELEEPVRELFFGVRK